ncbi:hypothetical protein KCP71_10775 [Salmonella enterica subsp. enterica]|nr:hypothetical protein KCP71_10775 [Salmonella enterica subsp. enterica]
MALADVSTTENSPSCAFSASNSPHRRTDGSKSPAVAGYLIREIVGKQPGDGERRQIQYVRCWLPFPT